MTSEPKAKSVDTRASLFGKLPSVLDYVRVNHDTREALALDQWMQAAFQHLAERGTPWPDRGYRFVMRPKACTSSLVGVIAPSRDRAGRKYPLAIFAPLPQPMNAASHAATSLGAQRFFDQADQLLATLAKATASECAALLAQLIVPTESDIEVAQGELDAHMGSTSLSTFLATLQSPLNDAPELARSIIESMTALVDRGQDGRLTLDLPARSGFDVAVWVAMLESATSSPNSARSYFWNHSEPSRRMLFGAGSPSPMVPLWLASPHLRSEKLQVLLQTATRLATPATDSPAADSPAADGGPPDDLTLRDLSRAVRSAAAG